MSRYSHVIRMSRKFLLYFAHDHIDFRAAELNSIIDFFKIRTSIPYIEKHCPFVTLELENEEDARKISSRSILTKAIFEYWTSANTIKELYTQLESLPKKFTEPYLKSKQSFRYNVSAFNKKLNKNEIFQIIDNIPLPFEGPVDLKSPCESYHILLDYGSPDTTTEQLKMVYFGRWIADGQRDIIQDYHLKKRKFIANTSMDAQLSMIIANIAAVGPNMWVHDPFVGSGGLLVAAAHFGAHVSGTDIDYLLLHAKAAPSRKNQLQRDHDESIRANLQQYGNEHLYIDVLVADMSKQGIWRDQPLFDAIITDPPYGIREGAKKVAMDQPARKIQENLNVNTEECNSKKEQYCLSDMFKDLLNFCARHLHLHGRLVYWFPVVRKDYTDDNLPTHPCFKLLYNCEQIINTKVSRRLITMEKIADLQNESTEAEIKVDHYENKTFRQRYFHVDKRVVKTDQTDAKIDTNVLCSNSQEPNGIKECVTSESREQDNVISNINHLSLDNT